MSEQTITLGKLVSLAPALQALSSIKLKPAVGYRVATFNRHVRDHLTAYDEQRKILLDEYGTPTKDDPTRYELTIEGQRLFPQAHDDLLAEEVSGLTLPSINFATDLKTDGVFVPTSLAPLVGLILLDVDKVGGQPLLYQDLEFTRSSLIETLQSLMALGARELSHAASQPILLSLDAIDKKIAQLVEEEKVLLAKHEGSTDEVRAAAFDELSKVLVRVRLAGIQLDLLGDTEIEPSVFQGLDKLILT